MPAHPPSPFGSCLADDDDLSVRLNRDSGDIEEESRHRRYSVAAEGRIYRPVRVETGRVETAHDDLAVLLNVHTRW
jgi:hypothetical protein